VVFRTDAIDGEYDVAGVLIAVDVNGDTILEVFEYNPSASTSKGSEPDSMTPEGYGVYIEDSGSRIVIETFGALIAFTVPSPIPSFDTTRVPIIAYGEKRQETYKYWTNPIDFDTDKDTIPDGWIEDYFMDDSASLKSPFNGEDLDGSGDISGDDNDNTNIDASEIWYETNPRSRDSDKDRISDDDELYFDEIIVDLYLTVWNQAGSGVEQYELDAIENYIDSDNDDIYGLDEYDSDNDNRIDPVDRDSDGDGLFDWQENWDFDAELDATVMAEAPYYHYTNPYENPFFNEIVETNPYNKDSDGDGLTDGLEMNNDLYPLDWDTDNDLLIDGYLGIDFNDVLGGEDKDNDGVVDSNEPLIIDQETNPLKRDTDKDGVIDGFEFYYMDDYWTPPLYSDTDGDLIINLLDIDSDDDGLKDGEENWDFDKFLDAELEVDNYYYYNESNPYDSDCDNDGLWDGAETLGFNNSDEESGTDYFLNIWDQDSNDGVSYPGSNPNTYPPTVPYDLCEGSNKNDYVQTYVVFRTNAKDLDNDEKLNYDDTKVWIAVDQTSDLYYNENGISDPNALDLSVSSAAYLYTNQALSGLTEENDYDVLFVYYSSINPQIDPVPIFTPEGYEVLVDETDSSIVYIHPVGGLFYKFQKTSTQPPSHAGYADYVDDEHSVTNSPVDSHNFLKHHQETYDGRPARDVDRDGDGLMNWEEDIDGSGHIQGDDGNGILEDGEEWCETDPDDADTDKDGVIDGDEKDWNEDSDGDGRVINWNYGGKSYSARTMINALDSDSDEDGLKDGTEIGLTLEDLRSDVRKSMGNLASNDMRIGNFVPDADSGTTITDPLNIDTDGDNLPDGWIDGWTYHTTNGWGKFGTANELKESIEYEDKNLDGEYDKDCKDQSPQSTDEPESDPLNNDTDYDGFHDGVEISVGLVRWDKDSDDDGLEDGNVTEGLQNTDGDADVNAKDTDSDGDYIWDGVECGIITGIEMDSDNRWYGTNDEVFLMDIDPTSVTDPLLTDSDTDGIDDGDEDYTEDSITYDKANPAGTNYNGRYDLIKDSLSPGEAPSFINSETDPSEPDSDFDGFNDNVEYSNSMWPNDVDSDDDGLRDDHENEGDQNSDTDTLVNAADSDSDNDFIPDGVEMGLARGDRIEDTASGFGTDVNEYKFDTHTNSVTDPHDSDTDNDLIIDGLEDKNSNGKYDRSAGETDPDEQDSDGDGIDDGIEDGNHNGLIDGDWGGDGICGDTNGNAREDASEVWDSGEGDRIINHGEIWSESSPSSMDTDGDRLMDNVEDVNKNGYNDAGETHTYSFDTDNDGLWDGRGYNGNKGEIDYGTDALNPDTDGDTLLDGSEVDNTHIHNSDPAEYDSDGDGLNDAEEVLSYALTDTGPHTGPWEWTFPIIYNGSYIITIEAEADDDLYDISVYVDSELRLRRGVYSHRRTYEFDVPLMKGNHILRIEGDPSTTTYIHQVDIIKQITRPKQLDTDSDGLSDGMEVFGWDICVIRNVLKWNHTQYGDPIIYEGEEFYEKYWEEYDNDNYFRDTAKYVRHVDSNPIRQSTFSDDLTDYQNFVNGTDPRSSDTDEDGISDYTEALYYDGAQYNPTAQDYFEPQVTDLTARLEVDSNENVELFVSVYVGDVAETLYRVKVHAHSFHDGLIIDIDEHRSETWEGYSSNNYFVTTFNLGNGWFDEAASEVMSHHIDVKAMDMAGNINVSEVHITGLSQEFFEWLASLWNSFVEGLQAFLEALLNIWELVIKPMVEGFVNFILSPIINMIEGYVRGVGDAKGEAIDNQINTGGVSNADVDGIGRALLGPLYDALKVIGDALKWVSTLISPLLNLINLSAVIECFQNIIRSVFQFGDDDGDASLINSLFSILGGSIDPGAFVDGIFAGIGLNTAEIIRTIITAARTILKIIVGWHFVFRNLFWKGCLQDLNFIITVFCTIIGGLLFYFRYVSTNIAHKLGLSILSFIIMVLAGANSFASFLTSTNIYLKIIAGIVTILSIALASFIAWDIVELNAELEHQGG
jgi:hypothetical protein